jgi:hypothetical protein
MAFHQLTYRSRVEIDPTAFREECRRILERARMFNRRHDITGCLAYTPEWFIQVIEGERANVDKAFSRIEMDSRHSSVEILGRRDIRSRGFPEWTMAELDLTENADRAASSPMLRSGFYFPDRSPISAQLLMLLSLADQNRNESAG